MGQIGLSEAIGVCHSTISRYEGGLLIPDTKPLLRLLSLAQGPAERRPILRELKNHGIDEIIQDLTAAGLLQHSAVFPTVSVRAAEEAMSNGCDSLSRTLEERADGASKAVVIPEPGEGDQA